MEHYQTHRQAGKCIRCTWERNSCRWIPKLPAVLPDWQHKGVSSQAPRTWVHIASGPDGDYTASCIACSDYGWCGPRMDLACLARHHNSQGHRRQMMDYLGIAKGPHGEPISGAPPFQDFLKVWQARAHNHGLESLGGPGEVRQLAGMYQ
jgi:hypothetical protein